MDTGKIEDLRENGQTFAEMFEESLRRQDAVKEGEIVKGRVIEVREQSVLVDIGYKSEASVPLNEFSVVDGKPSVDVGQELDLYVESREDDTGLVTGQHGGLAGQQRRVFAEEFLGHGSASVTVPSMQPATSPPIHTPSASPSTWTTPSRPSTLP